MKQIVSFIFVIICLFTTPATIAPSTATDDSIRSATTDEVVATVTTTEQPTIAETVAETTETPTEAEPTETCEETPTEEPTEEVEPNTTEEEPYDPEYNYDLAEDEVRDESPAVNSTGYSNYSDYDLDLLSRVICVEAGCEWIPDWVQLYVGSVVLNRVNSSMYPDTIEGVLYDPGQYNPYALYNYTPDERTIANARQLLANGSVLPADILGQNGECTGDGMYDSYYDDVLGSTVYFTYVYGY